MAMGFGGSKNASTPSPKASHEKVIRRGLLIVSDSLFGEEREREDSSRTRLSLRPHDTRETQIIALDRF